MAFLQNVKRGFGRTFSFFSESWSELKKVRWPNRKEMTSYTLVVISTVAFVAVYFFLLDIGITQIIRAVFE